VIHVVDECDELVGAGSGMLTPEGEAKLLINSADHHHHHQADIDNNDDNDDIKRRSSAGTYSLSSDSQTDAANNTAAGIALYAWPSTRGVARGGGQGTCPPNRQWRR